MSRLRGNFWLFVRSHGLRWTVSYLWQTRRGELYLDHNRPTGKD